MLRRNVRRSWRGIEVERDGSFERGERRWVSKRSVVAMIAAGLDFWLVVCRRRIMADPNVSFRYSGNPAGPHRCYVPLYLSAFCGGFGCFIGPRKARYYHRWSDRNETPPGGARMVKKMRKALFARLGLDQLTIRTQLGLKFGSADLRQ